MYLARTSFATSPFRCGCTWLIHFYCSQKQKRYSLLLLTSCNNYGSGKKELLTLVLLSRRYPWVRLYFVLNKKNFPLYLNMYVQLLFAFVPTYATTPLGAAVQLANMVCDLWIFALVHKQWKNKITYASVLLSRLHMHVWGCIRRLMF